MSYPKLHTETDVDSRRRRLQTGVLGYKQMCGALVASNRVNRNSPVAPSIAFLVSSRLSTYWGQ